VTLIGDLFVDRQRTTAMGLNASVLSIGTAAYPAVGGALAMVAWSAPFALALLALPVAILAVRRLHVAPKGHKADLNAYFGDLWDIVRRREVLVLFFTSTAIFILLYGAYITFLPFLMAGRFGSTPLGIGLLMAGLSISTAVTSANLGRLARILGEVRVMRVGFVVFGLGLALVPLAPVVWALAVPAVLLGFAFATTIPVVQVLLTEIAPVDRRGAVMSLNGTVLRLGQTLGPPVMALVHRVAGIDAVFYFGAVFALFLAVGIAIECEPAAFLCSISVLISSSTAFSFSGDSGSFTRTVNGWRIERLSDVQRHGRFSIAIAITIAIAIRRPHTDTGLSSAGTMLR